MRYTPLHYAVEEGRDDDAEILLAQNDQLLNAQDGWEGRTPLHLAVLKGNKRMVNFLLDKGAAIDVQDVEGRTPLHLAAEKYRGMHAKLFIVSMDLREKLEIVKVLIAKGKASLVIKNRREKTPFELLLDTSSQNYCFCALESIRDCLVILLDYLQYLKAYREAGVKQQQLVDYLMQFENYVQCFNNNSYGRQRIDLDPLQQARKSFYDPIREHYGCPTASDKVVAYFLDNQHALLKRRARWLTLLESNDPKQYSPLLNLTIELKLLIIKMVIQSRETFDSVSFSSEEKTDYKVLVQSFFDKEPLSIEEESNPAMSTETPAVTFKA